MRDSKVLSSVMSALTTSNEVKMMSNAKPKAHDALIQTSDWLSENAMPVALVLTETLEPALGRDAEIFPPAGDGDGEDFGRAAIWDAYGAWKPEAAQ